MTPHPPTALAAPLQRLRKLEADLCGCLLERDAVVRAALVAVLARQHIVLLGPPGTAKSMLVELLAERVVGEADDEAKAFVWLLTRFTTPDELFGPISVSGLKHDEYRRITANKLPEAFFAFLDEIFKANSAILNALLSLLNERVFDNGSSRVRCPLNTCIAASNELPQGEELGALWDRFALRLMIEPLSDAAFPRLLQLESVPGKPKTLPRAELFALQEAAQQLPIPEGVINLLVQLRKELGGQGIVASDRRWRQCLRLLQAHAVLEGRGAVAADDLAILRDALWTEPDQRAEIAKVIARLASPRIAQAAAVAEQSRAIYDRVRVAQRGSERQQAKMQRVVESMNSLKENAERLRWLLEQARAAGEPTARIEQLLAEGHDQIGQVAELVL